MGRYTFRLPDIGEGIAEAEIVAWHVRVGDTVDEDARLADMMTDKATVEMESPVSGKVVEIAGEVGDLIPIGSALVVLEVEGEVDEGPAPKSAVVEERIELETPQVENEERVEEEDQRSSSPTKSVLPEPVEGLSFSAPEAPSPEGESGPSTGSGRTEFGAGDGNPVRPKPAQAEPVEGHAPRQASQTKALASPAVRARAKDLGIDLDEVKPAEGDRVRHSDLDAFLAYNAAGGFAPAGKRGADEQIRVIGLRRRIAENMAASKRHIPHFSYVEECDVTALEEMRGDLNDNRGSKPKLTLLPLLITAICRALPQFPMINARYDDEAGVVTRYGAVQLGIATQTDAGLMVPVIRDADAKNLWQLATEIARLAAAARDGTAKKDELSGSTLTVTSLGPLGGVATTPVINRPEVAIIGPNRIIERPMFVPDGMGGERIAKRKLMNLSISCDHRVVDGWDAASFVQAVRKLLETPVLLLAN